MTEKLPSMDLKILSEVLTRFEIRTPINFVFMKQFIKILALAVAVSAFPACESNLELEPYTALDASTGFKTKSDIEAALLGSYNAIQNSNSIGNFITRQMMVAYNEIDVAFFCILYMLVCFNTTI